MVSDERAVKRLNPTLGSSLIASFGVVIFPEVHPSNHWIVRSHRLERHPLLVLVHSAGDEPTPFMASDERAALIASFGFVIFPKVHPSNHWILHVSLFTGALTHSSSP